MVIDFGTLAFGLSYESMGDQGLHFGLDSWSVWAMESVLSLLVEDKDNLLLEQERQTHDSIHMQALSHLSFLPLNTAMPWQ